MDLYKLLRWRNDARAVQRAIEQRSAKPIVNRVGWKIYGRLTGRLGRKLFRP